MRDFIAALFAALTSMLNELTKMFTKTVPEVGESAFHAAASVNDLVRTARYEMLLENSSAIENLKAECDLSEAELAAIDKRMEY